MVRRQPEQAGASRDSWLELPERPVKRERLRGMERREGALGLEVRWFGVVVRRIRLMDGGSAEHSALHGVVFLTPEERVTGPDGSGSVRRRCRPGGAVNRREIGTGRGRRRCQSVKHGVPSQRANGTFVAGWSQWPGPEFSAAWPLDLSAIGRVSVAVGCCRDSPTARGVAVGRFVPSCEGGSVPQLNLVGDRLHRKAESTRYSERHRTSLRADDGAEFRRSRAAFDGHVDADIAERVLDVSNHVSGAEHER